LISGRTVAATLAFLLVSCGGVPPPPITVPSLQPPRRDIVLPDTESQRKFVIAVLSEGFVAGTEENSLDNQRAFERLVNGLFEVELRRVSPFSETARFAFRPIFVESAEAGVSTTKDPRDTAFGIVFNDSQADCYFTVSSDAVTKISENARSKGNIDYTVVLINSANARGCAIREKIALVTRAMSAFAFAHELGHTIADLYDEYPSAATPGTPITCGNCSTETDAIRASWSDLFQGDITVPTDPATAHQFGMFAGCARRTDAYHPARQCAMLGANDFYCRVCERLMKEALDEAPPLSPPLTEQYTYYRFIVRGSGSDANPTIADQWKSFEPPRGGVQPLHGMWTLTVGERTVLGAMAVTGDPLHWRAYDVPGADDPPDHYVPAPFSVIEIAVPHARVKDLSPDPDLDPRLELFLFAERRELAPTAIDMVPGGFIGVNITARSPELTSAITSLLQ
jgi:hypothetical protein